jgi:preprotein translocase subunit SecE
VSGVRVSQPVQTGHFAMIQYVKESFEELKKHVTWTAWPELQRLTTVVLVFSILFSLAIWGADSVLSRFVKFYFQLIQ